MSATCRTVSGKIWNLEEPDPELVDIYDIAHALSMQCRFNGNIRAFLSVAQHAVHVALVVYKETDSAAYGLQGLHHDDSEAYLGDIIGPLKRLAAFDFYRALEERTMEAIATKLGFALPIPEIVSVVDKRMCGTEQRDLGVNAVPDRNPYEDIQIYAELGIGGDVPRESASSHWVCLPPKRAAHLYLLADTYFRTVRLKGKAAPEALLGASACERILRGEPALR